MKRFRWDKKYLYWGMTAFLVIASCIVFYMLVSNLTWLGKTLRKLGSILSPFVWGLVIAYLLYPLMQIYQRGLFTPLGKLLWKKSPRAERAVPKFSRGLAVFLSIITMLIIVGGLLWAVVPQLYSTVESIIVNSQSYIDTVDAWLGRLLVHNPELEAAISGSIGDVSNGIVTWATNNLLPQMRNIITDLSKNVISVFRGIYNIIIGIIVSVYMLYSRDTFGAHCKKILYSVFSLEASKKILDAVKFMNEVFMGFISGKILDSLIIGILCYIGCMILNIDFALLVSFLVGVTNIIPFFGPLIGAVPSTVIILMVSPMHALVFVIFIILLQQFDANILGPKILGNRIGINGFWVLFAIIFGAGLFGFAGMLLGVPVFVIIYTFFTNLINRKLIRSNLPHETEIFKTVDHFDPKTGEIVPREDRRHRRARTASRRGAAGGRFGRKRGRAAEPAAPPEPRADDAPPPVSGDEDASGQP